MRRCVPVALILMLVAAGPARASRAELDGRGLPRLLGPDESLLGVLPGAVGSFPGGVLIDWVTGSTTYIYTEYGAFPVSTTDDRFFSALTSGNPRFGYVLDGDLHNLILGGNTWGVTLGFGDSFEKDEQLNEYTTPSDTRIYYSEREISERRFRLGLGWRTRTAGGRWFEIGLGGSYLQSEYSLSRLEVDGSGIEEDKGTWKSDPGLGVDVTARTLPGDSGLLAAGRFRYEDLNPDVREPFRLSPILRSGDLQLGWRLRDAPIDDLVIGVSGSARVTATLYLSGSTSYGYVAETRRKDYRGFLFVSGEHEILENLRVRGGVQGGGYFTETATRNVQLDVDRMETRDTRDSNASLNSPQVFLGAGWSYKFLRIDAQVRDSINLDSPFIRWSFRLDL